MYQRKITFVKMQWHVELWEILYCWPYWRSKLPACSLLEKPLILESWHSWRQPNVFHMLSHQQPWCRFHWWRSVIGIDLNYFRKKHNSSHCVRYFAGVIRFLSFYLLLFYICMFWLMGQPWPVCVNKNYYYYYCSYTPHSRHQTRKERGSETRAFLFSGEFIPSQLQQFTQRGRVTSQRTHDGMITLLCQNGVATTFYMKLLLRHVPAGMHL